MAKIVLLFVVALAAVYSQAHVKPNIQTGRKVTPQIVGGEVSPLGAFPHQVSFSHDGHHVCGASIISSETIVTAAHCCEDVYNYFPELSVLAGANNVNSPESGFQRITVEKLIIHPNYDSSRLINDICIIRLTEPLILSPEKRTSVIKLPQEGYTASGMAVVSGWGSTSEDEPLSPSLMNVTVPVITDQECRRCYDPEELDISDSMICAGEKGKDSCQGDSGGPLMDSAGMLVGIVSWGIGCARERFPGVYTEVSAFSQWIKETMSS